MEKLKAITRKHMGGSDPGCFSGRGPTIVDLNSDMLSNIHKDIIKEYGKNAGKAFVEMVAAIKVLSATHFLNELYCLYGFKWVFKEDRPVESDVIVPKNENGEYDIRTGMDNMMERLMNIEHGQTDDTQRIRGQFLQENGVSQHGDYIEEWGPDGVTRVRYY